ncbi:hypothetical protein [Thermovibrio sp.]
MRKLLLIFPLFVLASCATTKNGGEAFNPPPPPPMTALDRKLAGAPSQELPVMPNINYNKLPLCTRYLLFTDQYITASDYDSAADTLKEAGKYCSKEDPRFNYMKALLLDIQEKKKEAFKYYYKAAKEYLAKGNYDEAFKCYSNMLSIAPNSKEVKELKKYFEDEDY